MHLAENLLPCGILCQAAIPPPAAHFPVVPTVTRGTDRLPMPSAARPNPSAHNGTRTKRWNTTPLIAVRFTADARSALDKTDKATHYSVMRIDDIKAAAIPACRDFNVLRLDAFGSIARGTSTASSDVDLLVEFRDPGNRPAKRFFGLLHRLQDGLGCEVDLLTLEGLRNPYFRERVLRERIPLYEG